MMKRVENITERITDSIKLEDKKLIEEIVETEEWNVKNLLSSMPSKSMMIECAKENIL